MMPNLEQERPVSTYSSGPIEPADPELARKIARQNVEIADLRARLLRLQLELAEERTLRVPAQRGLVDRQRADDTTLLARYAPPDRTA
jgi:hypothetical protein